MSRRIESLADFHKMMKEGVVFDWHLAADLLSKMTAPTTVAYASLPHGGRIVIWRDGGPAVKEGEFSFLGTHCFELHIGEEVWNCFEPKDEHPDWDANTYWPDSARTRLKS